MHVQGLIACKLLVIQVFLTCKVYPIKICVSRTNPNQLVTIFSLGMVKYAQTIGGRLDVGFVLR
jgi:hypothetical protein